MSATKIRYINFHPSEWLEGTTELNPFDRGVYITICALIWARGGWIGEELLKRHLGVHGSAMAASLNRLHEAGKIARNGSEIVQKRAGNELENAQKRARNAAENGAKGGRPNGLAKPDGFFPSKANQEPRTNIYSEEAKASPAADAAANGNHDPVKEMFDRGVAILGHNRRALLGKMCKQYGQAAVLAAIVATESAAPVEPVSYFVKACEQRQTNGHKHGPLTTLWEGAYNAARKWEETHGDSGDRGFAHVPLLDERRVDGSA